jgi:ribosomal protein L37AE/L43A
MSNLFRVITWKESGENEKCPKCLNIRQDFMEIMPNVWACYQCGCVFVPKAVRYKELEGKREQVALQQRERAEKLIELVKQDLSPTPAIVMVGDKIVVPEGAATITEAIEKANIEAPQTDVTITLNPTCEICGKVCGSKAGLAAHMRSHN